MAKDGRSGEEDSGDGAEGHCGSPKGPQGLELLQQNRDGLMTRGRVCKVSSCALTLSQRSEVSLGRSIDVDE
jgi:hypothetical protein